MKNYYFNYSPGRENQNGNDFEKKGEEKKNVVEKNHEVGKKEKSSFISKIKKALQTWSNGDKSDEDFDNTQV